MHRVFRKNKKNNFDLKTISNFQQLMSNPPYRYATKFIIQLSLAHQVIAAGKQIISKQIFYFLSFFFLFI